jgi:hypothetical protein
MAGEALNMSILDINKHRCKLKDLCSKNRHKSYTHRWLQMYGKTIYKKIKPEKGIGIVWF